MVCSIVVHMFKLFQIDVQEYSNCVTKLYFPVTLVQIELTVLSHLDSEFISGHFKKDYHCLFLCTCIKSPSPTSPLDF